MTTGHLLPKTLHLSLKPLTFDVEINEWSTFGVPVIIRFAFFRHRVCVDNEESFDGREEPSNQTCDRILKLLVTALLHLVVSFQIISLLFIFIYILMLINTFEN